MSYPVDLLVNILDAFRNEHPLVYMERGFSSVQILVEKKSLKIQIGITKEYYSENKEKIESLTQDSFSYEIDNKKTAIPINIKSKEKVSFTTGADIRAGNRIRSESAYRHGTGGWSIFLNGVPVCVSNHHVLCDRQNETPIGHGVCHFPAGRTRWECISTLRAYEPRYPLPAANDWDYALAEYRDQDDWLAEFSTPCNGEYPNYPDRLSTNVNAGDGERYFKVGATSGCTSGELLGVSDFRTDTNYFFKNQIFFSLSASPGDSGSVIVRESDNSVTGLQFAVSDEGYSFANRIYLFDWHLVGWKRAANDVKIPVFRGSETPTELGITSLDPFKPRHDSAPHSIELDHDTKDRRPGLKSGRSIIDHKTYHRPNIPSEDYYTIFLKSFFDGTGAEFLLLGKRGEGMSILGMENLSLDSKPRDTIRTMRLFPHTIAPHSNQLYLGPADHPNAMWIYGIAEHFSTRTYSRGARPGIFTGRWVVPAPGPIDGTQMHLFYFKDTPIETQITEGGGVRRDLITDSYTQYFLCISK